MEVKKDMRNDRLENLIEAVVKSESDSIKGLGDIAVPDINETLNAFRLNIGQSAKTILFVRGKKGRKSSTKWLRTVAAAMIFVMLSWIFAVCNEIPEVKAFRLNLVKTLVSVKDSVLSINSSNNDNTTANEPPQELEAQTKTLTLEEARKELPFTLGEPGYIPSGYSLKSIVWQRFPDKSHIVTQTYTDQSGKLLKIDQYYNFSDTNSNANFKAGSSSVREIDINGNKVTVADVQQGIYKAMWFSGNIRYEVIIYSTEQELINVIQSMKQEKGK